MGKSSLPKAPVGKDAHTLMVQGTASDAGKTTLVAGLCRLYARSGTAKIAPFKPQNMALNSAVTIDGGEIGRAQALQAAACFQSPHTDFNPVLLKPASNTVAQVIFQGKALTQLEAVSFFGKNRGEYKSRAMEVVLDSWQRLKSQYQLIFVEGAGSPAEINLREGDIANMGFAEEVDCPVILVADIDKGGVFAQLVGTLELLSDSERERVKGFVINRFRGDISLLQSGLEWLEERTGKPVIGVLPYLEDLRLDAEDAVNTASTDSSGANFKVQVLVHPRISNHTDFDALRLNPHIDFSYLNTSVSAQGASAADLMIIPGSKSVRDDLRTLINNGWGEHIRRHLRYGGKVIGICGGYQMLGLEVDDPAGVEGEAGVTDGLELLSLITELKPQKQVHNVEGTLRLGGHEYPVKGYEIHCGHSHKLRPVGSPLTWQRAVIEDAGSAIHRGDGLLVDDGMISEDNQIFGTYLHGLFDSPEATAALLQWAGMSANIHALDMDELREQELDRLADTLAEHLDINLLNAILAGSDTIKTEAAS
ncbi:cobyric acid synthase [Shewanella corallii]|uniref:Cobyric acid synthase n=1 Tax=Shewanella corallii TaxID=560080 RepID=A0ABT0NBT8_9GAMM|nr:cobyric acid synthase [Shewanella corallii]MCL2915903.1 cobyric acid synthase [Shewanella corallii]